MILPGFCFCLVVQTRRADRLQWACPSSRVILDNVNDVLSQNGSVTSLDDSLLESLQQTCTCVKLCLVDHGNDWSYLVLSDRPGPLK